VNFTLIFSRITSVVFVGSDLIEIGVY